MQYFFFVDGNRFFSLVKTLARSFADNERLNFVWIDPDPFPAVSHFTLPLLISFQRNVAHCILYEPGIGN